MAALVLINFRARNIDAQDTALLTSRTRAIFRYMRVRRSLLSLIFLSPVAIARVDAELVKFLLRVRCVVGRSGISNYPACRITPHCDSLHSRRSETRDEDASDYLSMYVSLSFSRFLPGTSRRRVFC